MSNPLTELNIVSWTEQYSADQNTIVETVAANGGGMTVDVLKALLADSMTGDAVDAALASVPDSVGPLRSGHRSGTDKLWVSVAGIPVTL